MADIANTITGFLQTGVLYATVLQYKMSASAVIGIQVLTNLLIWAIRTTLVRNGITDTNMMYEILLGLVLIVLYFWILLSRFTILETIGIWIVITVAMIMFTLVSLLLSHTNPVPSRTATLDVPVEPRYVVPMSANGTGQFNRYQTHLLV